MFKTLLVIAAVPVVAHAGYTGDSQVIGLWKFKTMNLGAAAGSPQAQDALKKVKEANPTIVIKAHHLFVMNFGKVEEGTWKLGGANTITFTLSKVGNVSVRQLRKEFEEKKAKEPGFARVMGKADPFLPLTATFRDHGRLLAFSAKQTNGEEMIFSKAR